jgi:hypothetical protein
MILPFLLLLLTFSGLSGVSPTAPARWRLTEVGICYARAIAFKSLKHSSLLSSALRSLYALISATLSFN